METFTKLEGYEKLQEWIQDTVLLDLIMKSEAYHENYAASYIEKLAKDGTEGS